MLARNASHSSPEEPLMTSKKKWWMENMQPWP